MIKPLEEHWYSNRYTPLVSVVIPVYNAAKYISGAIDSVLAQTFTNYELIVVNDGSPDTEHLEQTLKPYLSRIVYIKQQNQGVSAARNTGIKVAKGRIYAQLDADDLWKPDYLEKQIRYLKRNPNVDLVYPNALIFHDDSNEVAEFMKVSPSDGQANFEHLVREKCTVMTSVTAKIEIIKKAGMFDETLPACEDFDLWLRFLKCGGEIGYHKEILVRYRRRPESLSSDRVWMTRNIIRVLDKVENTLPLTATEREAVKRESVRRRAMLQLMEGKRALQTAEVETARRLLEEANSYFHNPKILLVLHALRYCPTLVTWLIKMRRRWLSRSSRNVLIGLE